MFLSKASNRRSRIVERENVVLEESDLEDSDGGDSVQGQGTRGIRSSTHGEYGTDGIEDFDRDQSNTDTASRVGTIGASNELPALTLPRHLFSKGRLERFYTALGASASSNHSNTSANGVSSTTEAELSTSTNPRAGAGDTDTDSRPTLRQSKSKSKSKSNSKQQFIEATYAWGESAGGGAGAGAHRSIGVSIDSISDYPSNGSSPEHVGGKSFAHMHKLPLPLDSLRNALVGGLHSLPDSGSPLHAKPKPLAPISPEKSQSYNFSEITNTPSSTSSTISASVATSGTGISPSPDKFQSPDKFMSPVRVDASPSITSSPTYPSPTSAHGSLASSPMSLEKYASPVLAHAHPAHKSAKGASGSSPAVKAGLFFAFPSPTGLAESPAPTRSKACLRTDTKTHSNTNSQFNTRTNDDNSFHDKGLGTGRVFENISTHRADQSRASAEIMARKLSSIQDKLLQAKREGTEARAALLASADSMVAALPLKYLYAKPELRKYAIERAMKPFVKLAQRKLHTILRHYLHMWRTPPASSVSSEMQVGFLVIATFLAKMLTPIYTKAFTHWMKLYSARYHKDEDIRKNMAASQIAEWYRHCRITKRKLFKFFTDTVKVCLDRRKAIKHTINFEMSRRSSLQKFIRAIGKRRRKYFAARSIMRPYLWFKLYRKVQARLTRKIYARVLQRWFRMTRYRPVRDRYLIGKILYFGGFSVVYPKVPQDLIRRNGFLNGFDACASRLQRAWFVSKGNFAAFMIAAARRAKEEYEQMRNDAALILQSNFRGHLWNLLNLAAREWNRARRISFAFRHYQYRCWHAIRVRRRKHRPARLIQRWLRNCLSMKSLHARFVLRKITFIWANLKRTMAAGYIQCAYRAHLERERIKLEEFKAWVAQQRANAEKVAKMIVKIQMVWRKLLKSGNRFPRHVYLICWRIVRARRKVEYLAAMRIQKIAKPFCAYLKELDVEFKLKAAQTIWFIAKNYLLKLAIWDRVQATKLIQKHASMKITHNLRNFLFWRHMKIRSILRRHQKAQKVLIFKGATYIQRWVKRKWAEYFIPVRSAARYEVQKKREREEKRRLLQIREKYALFILRFFRMFKPYYSNVRLVERERYRIKRIHMARRIQKFARKIVAWARFDKVVAHRKKHVASHPINVRRRYAANVIGFYFRRMREKAELETRFIHRKFVLSEYRRLEALKVEAYKLRDIAIEDKRRTDENMLATIRASWKQGSDITGKNYYYNYVTGESQWDPPEGWKVVKAINKWMRQMDDRANIYYYNMETQESAWLPPCHECGEGSEKYCTQCTTAFCERCFDVVHHLDEKDVDEDPEIEEMKLHLWSLVEYEKDLLKPGEIYCLECKRRNATLMCLVCWDPYCKECFRYSHHTGNLKYHRTMAYKKVKQGWMCVKATSLEDADYYVNGITGITSYEKPFELMSEEERRLYTDFLNHQKAAQDHVKTIEALQMQLEEASFERDSILQDAMNAGFLGASVTRALKNKKTKKQQQEEDKEASANVDVVGDVKKAIKPGRMDWLFGSNTTEYKQKLLQPKDRERNAQKSAYMGKLLADIQTQQQKDKAAARNALIGR